MGVHESLTDFYQSRSIPTFLELDSKINHYDVFKLEESGFTNPRPARYCRRDFFKIALIRGHNRCHYANKSIEIYGSALLFFSPYIPYTWEPLSDENGYFCIFKESFFSEGFKADINNFAMFKPGGNAYYNLNEQQDTQVSMVFERMLQEKESNYHLKQDLSRSYVSELIHAALKLEPNSDVFNHKNASERLTAVFFELLHRQFQTDGTVNEALLKTPKEYADTLCVHVNYLNHTLKQTTGKTTTELIQNKIISEAQSLLKLTHLNISEIGNLLGFSDPSHFFIFFKKRTGCSPSSFRMSGN